MAKYRILEDHAHWNGSMVYIPQMFEDGKWRPIPGHDGSHEHLDVAYALINAHKKTGTPRTVVWDDDQKPPRWWQFAYWF